MFRKTEGLKFQMNFRVRYSHWNLHFCSSNTCNYLWLKKWELAHSNSPALNFCKCLKCIFPVKIILELSHVKFIESICLAFFKFVRRVQVHCRHNKHNNYLTSPTFLHLGKCLYTAFHHSMM